PMIDAGRRPPSILPTPVPFELNWSTGLLDLLGRARVQGDTIDIGAFEATPEAVFADGFE
ncbi:MAG: hypothetical protein KDI56_17300, partial [Xanthomonadales bacterium]|nr:hypothetical protein [Xanthomonadales bacterium]